MNRIVSSIIAFFSIVFVIADSGAQKYVTDIMMAQIGFVDTAGVNATVPPEVKRRVDICVQISSISAAISLGGLSVTSAILGAILSNRFLSRPSTNVYAHYDPDTHKLVLRFDRPVIVHNPQRMILLYPDAGGMAAAVPTKQYRGGGLTLAFATNIEKSPTRMELIICSGAMHPAGFPELDICADGRPIRVDVDILLCDT